MKKIILLRHGQSLWNLENKFTGWVDVDLSNYGRLEAEKAGQILKAEGYSFSVAYTSLLKRAIRTLWIVMDEMDLMWIPVCRSWRLNERHYGALQGLNKEDVTKTFGSEQVEEWRRGYEIRPPDVTPKSRRQLRLDPRYLNLKEEDVPGGESLKDALDRIVPFWRGVIVPDVEKGKKVIIVAHGNSLRALIKYLDNISDDEIVRLNIPTGIPLVYELEDNLKTIGHYYLGGKEKLKEPSARLPLRTWEGKGRSGIKKTVKV